MAKKRKSRKRPAVKAKRPGRAVRSINQVDTAELRLELGRRKRALGALGRKRARLTARIEMIDRQIQELGGVAPQGKRPRNERGLADALALVLKDAPMSVTDAAEAVQRAGYRTTSPNFRTIVNQALINDKRFKRVSRGIYRA